ncbi:MAG: selenide, water dikinase SelD [Candidatus Tectimicrobiota bacterium]
MQGLQTPIVKDLVLVGGGHSHVTVLKMFGMQPLPGVRLTVICRDVHTPYSGMLPGFIAGHYTYDDVHIDLEPLARFAGARFYHDEVLGLDLKDRLIRCRQHPDVPYDILSINTGSTPGFVQVPGAAHFGVPVKPISTFVARWQCLAERVLAAPAGLRIGVVGAGAGGIEMLLAMQFRLQQLLQEAGRSTPVEYHLLCAAPHILPTHNRRVQAKFRQVLSSRGVHVHTNCRVVEVTQGGLLHCADGQTQLLDEVLWVTDAIAPAWLAQAGLTVDARGFVLVNAALQSLSHPEVFAAGDVAAVQPYPREKAGVFAVRQGRPLTENLRHALLGQPLKPFVPQKQWLALISTGDQYAVASRGRWYLAGRWVWTWKDWIDRKFMDKYNHLPSMPSSAAPALPAGLAGAEALQELSTLAMRCGGCGAKVGATVLQRVLARLHPKEHEAVLVGLNAPDDAAIVAVPPGKMMVHTVDFFRAIIDDPYIFGKIAANHSLGDIFAMGAEAQTALAIATVPYGIEVKVEDTLAQMLLGAEEVLQEAGAVLVGGHSSEGAELSLGFAINGVVDPQQALRKGGMQPGDVLLLTKALGTGTLFAADMRHQAKGRWMTAALDSMLQSNRAAAQCLLEHQATACTDVTGFGLLGHLVEMTRASEVDVTLELGSIPWLDGARETVAAGIFSSLQPQNIRLRRAIRNLETVLTSPFYPLLFDPQTAGGLLASVPADSAADCLKALHALGYTRSSMIGTVHPKTTHWEPITVLDAV